MEVVRLDMHTNLAGSPVTVCPAEGVSYRVPSNMQSLAKQAFDASARGCVQYVERAKLHDILKAMADEAGEVEHPILASVAAALADRLLVEFDTEFRAALLTKLRDRRDSVLQGVLATLLE